MDPIRLYEEAIDNACINRFKSKIEEYKAKRAQSFEGEASIVISPSRASFFRDIGSEVKIFEGKCNRQSFLETKQATPTNLTIRPSSMRKMRYGQLFEEEEHIYEREAGILIENNFRLFKRLSDDVVISGELDTLVELDKTLYIIEMKSYDGYYAEKHIQGNKSQVGMPKYDHIAQNMFYLAMIKDHPKYSSTKGTIFHYRTRGTLHPTFHYMELSEVLGKNGEVIDAFPIINGSINRFTSLRELIVRGIQLSNFINENVLPPRDPEYCYSEDKIKYLLSIGHVSKSAYTEWQTKGESIGDWQCNKLYCPFFNLCMGPKPQNNMSNLPSDEDIMSKMYTKVTDTDSVWSL